MVISSTDHHRTVFFLMEMFWDSLIQSNMLQYNFLYALVVKPGLEHQPCADDFPIKSYGSSGTFQPCLMIPLLPLHSTISRIPSHHITIVGCICHHMPSYAIICHCPHSKMAMENLQFSSMVFMKILPMIICWWFPSHLSHLCWIWGIGIHALMNYYQVPSKIS